MISAHSPTNKQNYVTILAIYDDLPPSKNGSANEVESAQTLSIPVTVNRHGINTQFVEVRNLERPPVTGLQVQRENAQENRRQNLQKTQNPNLPVAEEVAHVHFSQPDEENDKLSKNFVKSPTDANLRMSNARKSRISNTFLEARERLEQRQFENEQWLASFPSNNYRFQRVELSAETQDQPMGLEISAVPNPDRPSRLLAVEVRSIEQRGRLAEDGRLRVGDQIVDINGISCEQISFARARLHLRELQTAAAPTLAFFRRICHTRNGVESKSVRKAEIQMNLMQKGNTSQIGQQREVQLVKASDGFGFSYAGRLNSRQEHLYYVKGLRRDQLGLAVGDRILRIDGRDLAPLDQAAVTALLKAKPVGTTATLLMSRTAEEEKKEDNSTAQNQMLEAEQEKENRERANGNGAGGSNRDQLLEMELGAGLDQHSELLKFDIPLNETPGAGLGISVKAQRMGSTDRGLYVRSILHGSAAYKDGRLQINDRLVGVEGENLVKHSLNGEALDAFMRTLTQLPKGKGTVRVFVARKGPASQQMCSRWGSDSEIGNSQEFVRDAATRRSISEKRPLGLHNDPSHLRAYQRIVHQRQTSAPALTSAARSRRSLHEPASLTTGNGGTQKPADSSREGKARRPKSTFYLDENNHLAQSRTLPKCQSPSSCSPHCQRIPAGATAIPISRSQPECMAFLTRSGTEPPQQQWQQQRQQDTNGNSTIKANTKRRSSLGSGLLKLFSRSQTAGREETRPQLPPSPPRCRPQHWRPPPPPYPAPWSYQAQQHPESSTGTNFRSEHGLPNQMHVQTSNSSFRFRGPDTGCAGVPRWQHADADLQQRHHRPAAAATQQPQMLQQPRWTTTINHSTSGSRPQLPAPQRATFSAAGADHFQWQSLPRPCWPQQQQQGNGKQVTAVVGKAQPSAVFYNDSGSHWVIRC